MLRWSFSFPFTVCKARHPLEAGGEFTSAENVVVDSPYSLNGVARDLSKSLSG